MFRADLLYAIRAWRKSPTFVASVVLCLAFGIGSSTTVFSWMEGLVLRPLPAVQDVDSLVTIRWNAATNGLAVSFPDYRDWRDQAASLSGLAAANLYLFGVRRDATSTSAVLPLYGVFATTNYFEVIGVTVSRGRTFRSSDDSPSQDTVAIVSDRFWRDQLGAAEDVIGRQIRLNDRPATIIGVVPNNFGGTLAGVSFDVWVPLTKRSTLLPSERDRLETRGDRWLDLIGRLRPGLTMSQAAAEFREIARRSSDTHPENLGRSIQVRPLDTGAAGQLTMLFISLVGITAVVILIVCSNVANLLLLRGTARASEISLRLSLGATPGRIVRQLMTENLVLAVAGAALGLLLARWSHGLLMRMMPVTSVPLSVDAVFDFRVLAFVGVVTGAAVILFGLSPAIMSSQVTLAVSLNGGARGTHHVGSRLRRGLIVTQFALCIAALVCTGLFLRRADQLRRLDAGFTRDAARVLLLQTELSLAGRSDLTEWQRTLDTIVDRIRRVPGVRAASVATFVPLGLVGYTGADVDVDGYTAADGELMRFLVNGVAPEYFDTMGISIVDGRPISEDDTPNRPAAAIVNEAFVRRFWKNAPPIGRHITVGGRPLTVVGVAKDGKYDYRNIDAPTPPLIYYALRQSPSAFVTIHVRTVNSPYMLVAPVRDAISSIDPLIPVLAPTTLDEYAAIPMFPTRLGVAVLGVLSAAALLLSAMGLYGMIAYGVRLRAREVGIRLAVGAPPQHILGIFLRETAVLIAAGTTAGIGAALFAAALMRTWLPQLPEIDAMLLLGPAALLVLVAFIAGFIPAMRAARTAPVTVLRMD